MATDGKYDSVRGARDLIDYFPIHVSARAAMRLFPPEKFRYRIIQDTGTGETASRVVFARTLIPDDSSAYLRKFDESDLYNQAANIAIGPDSPDIPKNFLDAAAIDKGLLLIEGVKPTTEPLALQILTLDNTPLRRCTLPVSVTNAEQMFRYLYTQPGTAISAASIPSSPPNWPDADRNGKHFVLAHGYSVNGDAARGWGCEFFKRLFWSGSNAMFTIFAWKGNQGQVEALGLTPDYQINLLNAFDTAYAFSQYLDMAPGVKTVAGHSMGNVLVGAAMTDWNARPAHYFMLDAAAAKECYDPTEVNDPGQDAVMVHPAWRDYPKQLRASEWHALAWPAGDRRATLTWRGRLAGAINSTTQTYNFYSSGEEVLNNPTANDPNLNLANPFANGALLWTKANKTWALQEKRKGYGITGIIHTSNHGGWYPNTDPYRPDIHIYTGMMDPDGILIHRMRTHAELPALTPAFLAARMSVPFFDDSAEPGLYDPDTGPGSTGSIYAFNNRDRLLTQIIPCTTCAAGRNPLTKLQDLGKIKNFDMDSEMKTDSSKYPLTNEFKENATDEPVRNWLHGDIRAKAYLHNWKAYDKFVELGNLK